MSDHIVMNDRTLRTLIREDEDSSHEMVMMEELVSIVLQAKRGEVPQSPSRTLLDFMWDKSEDAAARQGRAQMALLTYMRENGLDLAAIEDTLKLLSEDVGLHP